MRTYTICAALVALSFSQLAHAGAIGKAASAIAKNPAPRAATTAALAQRSSQIGRAESARHLYSMPKSTSPIVSTTPKINTPNPGVLPTRRQPPPIANDVFKQNTNGKLVRQTGKKETLLKNRIQGNVGQDRAITDLRAAGYKAKPQVTAKSNNGKRVIDIVAQPPSSKKLVSFEVKTGQAARSNNQKKFDLGMEKNGAKLVGKNAGNLANNTVKMPTTVLRY